MFLIKADLQFDNTFRQTPISGNKYRPLLFWGNNVIRSGLIVLEENETLEMTRFYENRLIKIYFYQDIDPYHEFKVGNRFVMAEGGEAVIGYGVVTEVIGEQPSI